jgi:hypothetical protein
MQCFLFVVVCNLSRAAGDSYCLSSDSNLFQTIDYSTDLAPLDVENLILAQVDVLKGNKTSRLHDPFRYISLIRTGKAPERFFCNRIGKWLVQINGHRSGLFFLLPSMTITPPFPVRFSNW